MQQVQNLADAGATDFTQAGQLRLIGDGAAAKKAIKADGQGHEPGQTRYTNCLGIILEATHVLTTSAGQIHCPPTRAPRSPSRFPFFGLLSVPAANGLSTFCPAAP